MLSIGGHLIGNTKQIRRLNAVWSNIVWNKYKGNLGQHKRKINTWFYMVYIIEQRCSKYSKRISMHLLYKGKYKIR